MMPFIWVAFAVFLPLIVVAAYRAGYHDGKNTTISTIDGIPPVGSHVVGDRNGR